MTDERGVHVGSRPSLHLTSTSSTFFTTTPKYTLLQPISQTVTPATRHFISHLSRPLSASPCARDTTNAFSSDTFSTSHLLCLELDPALRGKPVCTRPIFFNISPFQMSRAAPRDRGHRRLGAGERPPLTVMM